MPSLFYPLVITFLLFGYFKDFVFSANFTNLIVMWYSYLCVCMCVCVCVCVYVCVWCLYCLWYGELLASVGFFKYGKNFGHYFFALFEFSYSPLSYRDVNYMYVELLETSHVSVKLCSLFFQSLFLYASVWVECEVKWTLESITMNKASGGDGIPVELFQILKDDAVKVLHSIYQQFGKLSSGHRTGKSQFSVQSQRKAMPKTAQTTT